MGILDSFFDTIDSFFGGGPDAEAPAPAPEKPKAPDFKNYWKEYSGWMQNINDRNTGELANVRARLSAAGASPDQLMMQTEQLESQRKSEVAKLEGGQTKRFLDEAFEIATGKRENPYSEALPGMEVTTEMERYEISPASSGSGGEAGAPFEVPAVIGERPKTVVTPSKAGSMTEYFTNLYGTSPGAPEDAGEAALKRAKMGASGTTQAAGGGAGAVTSSVFGSDDDSFWR